MKFIFHSSRSWINFEMDDIIEDVNNTNIDERLPSSFSEDDTAPSFITALLSSPLNLFLLGVCFVILYKIIRAHSVNDTKTEPDLPPLKNRDLTLEQLKELNGQDGRILVAVNGKVFDVTKGKPLYGPNGQYSSFAGRDASRGLGTFSLNEGAIRDCYDDLSDLTSSEMDRIKEWEMQFTERYQLVGRLLKPGEEPTEYTDTEEEHGGTPGGRTKND